MTSPLEIEVEPAPVYISQAQLDPSPDLIVLPVPGPVGPQGPPGAGIGYDHTQASASAGWVIAHNLGYYPSVAVKIGTDQVIADVTHNSVNQVTITFASPQTGSAHLI